MTIKKDVQSTALKQEVHASKALKLEESINKATENEEFEVKDAFTL